MDSFADLLVDFCCGSFLILQEHKMCIEWEATHFGDISHGPLDCQNVQDSEESSSSLSSACEGNDGVQMFLSPECPGALMGASLM